MPSKEKRNVVGLGATVGVEVDGQKDEFQLVGSLEANPSAGRISNESPVGRALLGHRAGEAEEARDRDDRPRPRGDMRPGHHRRPHRHVGKENRRGGLTTTPAQLGAHLVPTP